jgi:hypothetical protein
MKLSVCILWLIGLVCPFLPAVAFVPPEIKERWKNGYKMDDAIALVEACAESGKNTKSKKELWWAVKYLDRFAGRYFYQTLEERQELMDRTNGSWELRLACNSDRDERFYPHPEFRAFAKAFSTVSDDYFGKGISTKDNGFCFVALGGPSTRIVKRRQVFMTYEDYFINGQQVSSVATKQEVRNSNEHHGIERLAKNP